VIAVEGDDYTCFLDVQVPYMKWHTIHIFAYKTYTSPPIYSMSLPDYL
jgi:hypothetical protein